MEEEEGMAGEGMAEEGGTVEVATGEAVVMVGEAMEEGEEDTVGAVMAGVGAMVEVAMAVVGVTAVGAMAGVGATVVEAMEEEEEGDMEVMGSLMKVIIKADSLIMVVVVTAVVMAMDSTTSNSITEK